MRIEILSDLHLEFLTTEERQEFFDQYKAPPDVDVLVLAGDIFTRAIAFECIEHFSESYKHVVFVAGNHEYYGSSPDRIHRGLTKASKRFENFHWLNRDRVVLEGVGFIGSTLWFADSPDNYFWKHGMNDFRAILGFHKWVYKQNELNVKYLTENVQADDIVISHHLPTYAAIDEGYRDNQLNRFYYTEMGNFMVDRRPAMWIHGHSHSSLQKKVGDTLVVRNPQGYYPNQRTLHNLKRLVFDIE